MQNGTLAREDGQPNDSSKELPETITAGGITRTVSGHAIHDTHEGITAEIIEFVLENWVIRGVKTDADGRQSLCYWAFVPQLEKMVRVAVSMDDTTIITAFRDTAATRHWNEGNLSYFVRHYQDLEERVAS